MISFGNSNSNFNQYVGPGASTGTAVVKYIPTFGDPAGMAYGAVVGPEKFITITLMKEYENKSLEELRLEDYTAGRDRGAYRFLWQNLPQFNLGSVPLGLGTVIKYDPVRDIDVVVKGGCTQTINVRLTAITCMKHYQGKSLEELRLIDYSCGRGKREGWPLSAWWAPGTATFCKHNTPSGTSAAPRRIRRAVPRRPRNIPTDSQRDNGPRQTTPGEQASTENRLDYKLPDFAFFKQGDTLFGKPVSLLQPTEAKPIVTPEEPVFKPESLHKTSAPSSSSNPASSKHGDPIFKPFGSAAPNFKLEKTLATNATENAAVTNLGDPIFKSDLLFKPFGSAAPNFMLEDTPATNATADAAVTKLGDPTFKQNDLLFKPFGSAATNFKLETTPTTNVTDKAASSKLGDPIFKQNDLLFKPFGSAAPNFKPETTPTTNVTDKAASSKLGDPIFKQNDLIFKPFGSAAPNFKPETIPTTNATDKAASSKLSDKIIKWNDLLFKSRGSAALNSKPETTPTTNVTDKAASSKHGHPIFKPNDLLFKPSGSAAPNFKPESPKTNVQEDNKQAWEECLKLAEVALTSKKYDTAQKLLLRAERMYPTSIAQLMLNDVRKAKCENSEGTSKTTPKSYDLNTPKSHGFNTPKSNDVNTPKSNDLPETNLDTYIRKSKEALEKGDFDKAEKYLRKAKKLREKEKELPDLINKLNISESSYNTNGVGTFEEANECIKIAEDKFLAGDRVKAVSLLHKAERIYSTDRAKDLLLQWTSTKNYEPPKVETKILKEYQQENTSQNNIDPTSEQLDTIRRILHTRDDYVILGLERPCTSAAVSKARRKLMGLLHPDTNSTPGAKEAFMLVVEAASRIKSQSKLK